MIIKASKICLSNPEKTNSFIKCHRFFPSNHQKKLLGELLFLIEIKIPENIARKSFNLTEEVSEIIINGLRTNYYTSEALREKDAEENFENALQKLNRLIYQEIIGSRSFEMLAKNLNAAIGLIHEEKIYFSSVGSTQVFILKKNKITDLVSEEVSFTPARLFSQIISGNLEKGDCLFFSTANFLDYFVFEKLSQIIQKNVVEESAQKLKELLKNLGDKISVGAILIKKEDEQVEKTSEPLPEKTFKKEKEETEREVAKISSLEEVPLKIMVEPEKEQAEEIIIKEEPAEKKEGSASEKFDATAEKKGKEIKAKKTRFKVKLPKISFAFLKKIHFPSFPKITLPKIILPKISPPKKRVKILLPIVLLVFAGFLIYNFSYIKIKEKDTADFFLSLMDVRAKVTLLNASLSYGDLKRTVVLVDEIKNKITDLKPKTKTEKDVFEKIKKEFETLTDKIYEITRTNKPNIFVDLSSISRKEGLKNVIKISNGNFIILNLANNGIYEFDLKNNKASLLIKTDAAFNKIISYSEGELLLASDNQIEIFNLATKKLSLLQLKTDRKKSYISDLKIFDNKLYILDNVSNQIFKYLKTADGFGDETAWLKESVNLKDIVSFALDGSVYLLKNSGELTKFFQGKKQSFNLENIYPTLTKPTKVYTDEEMRNIYILEPFNKRVLIYNKSGKLQKQIFSEEFDDLKDLVIDEKTNKLWLLNGTKIFTIDLKK